MTGRCTRAVLVWGHETDLAQDDAAQSPGVRRRRGTSCPVCDWNDTCTHWHADVWQIPTGKNVDSVWVGHACNISFRAQSVLWHLLPHTHTHTRKAQEQHGETLWLTQLNALLEEAETKRMRRKMANTDLFMLSKDKPSRRRPERRKASHVKRTETWLIAAAAAQIVKKKKIPAWIKNPLLKMHDCKRTKTFLQLNTRWETK